VSLGLWIGVTVGGSLGAGARFVVDGVVTGMVDGVVTGMAGGRAGGVVDGVAGGVVDGVAGGVARGRRHTRGRPPGGSDGRWAGIGLGTPLVNVTGSLLLGIVTGLVAFHGAPRAGEVVLGTGFCGGYTTFGTACVETVRLAQQGRSTAAAVHALAVLGLSTFAGGVGLALAAL